VRAASGAERRALLGHQPVQVGQQLAGVLADARRGAALARLRGVDTPENLLKTRAVQRDDHDLYGRSLVLDQVRRGAQRAAGGGEHRARQRERCRA
jgi:hypothetical protein